jgi:hypothetical protein
MFRIDDAHIGDPPANILAGPPTGSNSYTHDIAVNPSNADDIICVYSNYNVYSLFHSLDGGQSWKIIGGNLEQNPSGSGNGPSCRTAAIIPFDNDTLYLVGTTVGLFGTTDLARARYGQQYAYEDTTVWQQIGAQEFGSTIVEDIKYRSSDGLLVIATFGNGIYQINLTSPNVLLSSDEDLVDNFEMNIFPNPTTENINLSFNLNRPQDYRWVIYNELGAIVTQSKVHNNYSGTVNENINTNNFKSGVYFISLIINKRAITKEFIIN